MKHVSHSFAGSKQTKKFPEKNASRIFVANAFLLQLTDYYTFYEIFLRSKR
jgi:hypothetical protein